MKWYWGLFWQMPSSEEAGQGPLYLCNLNTRDFEPTSGDGLVTEYGRFGLACLPTFDVP